MTWGKRWGVAALMVAGLAAAWAVPGCEAESNGAPVTTTRGSATPLNESCNAWCARLDELSCAGVDAAACRQTCEEQFGGDACNGEALAAIDCYTASYNNDCVIPESCLPQVKAYAVCDGAGCGDTLICGASSEFDCLCGGLCGGSYAINASCNNSPGGFSCACRLTGPFGLESASTIETTCTGAPSDAGDLCDHDWGCCRDTLIGG